MRAPAFWRADGVLAHALAPAAHVTQAVTARRTARPGWRAPVPVICVGNATVGGSGKTTVAIDLLARLSAMDAAPHVLLRGHGGRSRGTRRVFVTDGADEVGDEALLLAAVAPTWIGGDRAASARAAVAAGAGTLVMDDGLQNPGLEKASVLVIDGGAGFGNGRVLPAGPLREPVSSAAARCVAAIMIGDDRLAARAALPRGLPVLTATLVADEAMRDLMHVRVVAFAGIGRPTKFFDTLQGVGADLAATVGYPDHHRYTARDVAFLLAKANALQALLVTTPKDAVRLPPALRDAARIAGVSLCWNDPGAIEALLTGLLAQSS